MDYLLTDEAIIEQVLDFRRLFDGSSLCLFCC